MQSTKVCFEFKRKFTFATAVGCLLWIRSGQQISLAFCRKRETSGKQLNYHGNSRIKRLITDHSGVLAHRSRAAAGPPSPSGDLAFSSVRAKRHHKHSK